jgi:hypothetical protein
MWNFKKLSKILIDKKEPRAFAKGFNVEDKRIVFSNTQIALILPNVDTPVGWKSEELPELPMKYPDIDPAFPKRSKDGTPSMRFELSLTELKRLVDALDDVASKNAKVEFMVTENGFRPIQLSIDDGKVLGLIVSQRKVD